MSELWWQECVVYHIYVRSFQDSNNDGIGDIGGIIQRLDYLEKLGVDAIWLSPIFASPNADYGYDVSNYYEIQEEYGTLEQFYELIESAHAKGIRVILDLVLNHTSHKHQWFLESRKSKEGPYSSYYIWSDTIPNNWMGAFGGKAWTYDKRRGQYYMHSFLKQQPDLNWKNPDVVASLHTMIGYWLDRGVDGFRLDVINSIVKDEALRNNPKILGHRMRTYDMQRHIFDRNRPEAHKYLRLLRRFVDTWKEKMLVGEIMVEHPGEPELAASYLGATHDELHLSFDFSLAYTKFNAQRWRLVAMRWYEAIGSHRVPTWVLNNHDLPRFTKKVRGDEQKLKLAALFLLTQRGAVFLYYGEELGLPNSKIWPSDLKDPLGKRYWPFHGGRDLCRGPMIWTTGPGNGFSTAEPWIEMASSANYYSVENQELEAYSLLAFYRSLIALRKSDAVLRRGVCSFIEHRSADLLVYTRVLENSMRLIILNIGRRVQFVSVQTLLGLEKVGGRCLFSTHEGLEEGKDFSADLVLAPFQGSVYEVGDQSLKSRSS
jgi:alpha-glucosidase